MKLTHQILHSAASNYCGWNKHQLELLGVKSPPKSGWLKKLVGTDVDENTWRKVILLRGIRNKAQRENILAEADKQAGGLTEYDALCAVEIAAKPFAEGGIDVSETAVILGFPATKPALEKLRAALFNLSTIRKARRL